MNKISIKLALNYAKDLSIDSLDARVLLKHCTNFTDLDILINSDSELSESEFCSYKNYLEQRANHKPIAYITGEKEFYSLNFKVTEDTLIPRPDTELLVDKVISYIQQNNIKNPKILDLGTGSGAIIISILKNIKNANAIAVDLNPKALKIAQENAELNNVSQQLKFVESNWFDNLNPEEEFDIIVSNPPYIKNADIQTLKNDVKNYEPTLALAGGTLGYEPYIDIINTSVKFFKPKGALFLEIGFDQREQIMLLLNKDIWADQKCYQDLANNDRLIFAKFTTNIKD